VWPRLTSETGPGSCPREWCSLRDADWLTLLDDATVLGVGADRVATGGSPTGTAPASPGV
jgi:hypothetical protein